MCVVPLLITYRLNLPATLFLELRFDRFEGKYTCFCDFLSSLTLFGCVGVYGGYVLCFVRVKTVSFGGKFGVFVKMCDGSFLS